MDIIAVMWSRVFTRQPKKPIKQRAFNTHSNWDIRKLRNSTVLTYNIQDCQNERPDPRFCEPEHVVYLSCNDPKSMIHNMLIAKHRNRVENEYRQFDGKKFFSFIVSARKLVGKQFLQKMGFDDRPSLLIPDFEDDFRIRIGITATYDDHKKKESLWQILKTIQEITPIVPNYQELFAPFLEKDFIETPILQALPYDHDYNPTYFCHSKTSYAFGSYFGHYLEDDDYITSTLPEIHRAILNHDEPTIEALLKRNPELASKKDPYGVLAHQLAYHLGPASLYAIFVVARKQYICKSPGDYEHQKHEERLLKNWQSLNIQTLADKHPNFGSSTKDRADYLALLKMPVPIRSTLHLAAIAGDLSYVKAILEANKNRIDEWDPRGYTPLLLAAANGHVKLVLWLINEGASTETVFHTNLYRGNRLKID